jgi:hypothetical protein
MAEAAAPTEMPDPDNELRLYPARATPSQRRDRGLGCGKAIETLAQGLTLGRLEREEGAARISKAALVFAP